MWNRISRRRYSSSGSESRGPRGVAAVEREAGETQECIRIRELLDSHVSGETSVWERMEVDAHLPSCAGCFREVESIARLRQAVRAAVEGTEGAATDLRDHIRARLREEPSAPKAAWRALAAAALIVAVGGWTALQYGPGHRESVTRNASADDVAFLDVGLKHHVHCVGDRTYGAVAPSLATLEANLEPEYAGLVAVVREHTPGDLAVTDAHRCSSIGRRFVHLVMRGDHGLVSLLVTERGGMALPRDDALGAVEDPGLHLEASREDSLGVSGFVTSEHLVYVVSGASNASAPQIAAAVGPAVRQFLVAHRI